MTQLQGYPSKDPSLESGGLAGALSQVLSKFLQNVDDMLPAKIVSYDRKANTATVQPLVAVMSTEGKSLSRANVACVPVLAIGGGNFVVNFPLKPGDLGWLKASDRDISLFMQGLKQAKPNTLRKHSFEDGLFIPDIYRKYTVVGEDFDANMVVQSLDGKIRVALWPDRVKTTCNNTSLEVNANGTITGTAPQKVIFRTPLVEFTGIFTTGTESGSVGTSTIHGNIIQTGGSFTVRDSGITSAGDQVAGGISTMGHVHSGIYPGSSNTNKPVQS